MARGLLRRVCVIGAGSSGIAACQALHGRGIPFDCFEAGSSVGGNWRYDNDNGMSSAYRPEPEINREITRYRTAAARRYARSGSDAIQVDFLPYLREIRKERAAGARRSRARRTLAGDQVPGSSRKYTPVRRLAGAPAQSP